MSQRFKFNVGDKVIFRKSMRECEVVQVLSNGNYIIARDADAQLLYATPNGLLPVKDMSDPSELAEAATGGGQ